MKKRFQIVARKSIIDIQTGKLFDDVGLRALDGIIYGEIKEVNIPVNEEELKNEMAEELITSHPNFSTATFQLVPEEQRER